MTNDLVTDQRVHKICSTLHELRFDVMLVGRIRKDSSSLDKRAYSARRMKLIFERGPLFYAEFNFRLFLFLLFRKAHLYYSNDLDTLPANFLAGRLKRVPVVYDSHEFFTETPEVIDRKWVRSIWLAIERQIFPKLRDVFTVSESIASEYKKRYRADVHVIRNVPYKRAATSLKTRKDLQLPEGKKLVILQGAGINIHRGAEELAEAMRYTTGAVLLIAGSGDVIARLKEIASTGDLDGKVLFRPKMPFEELYHYTGNADLGITIDKDTNPNYRYSLPNKLFDYIHAGIPVLATPLPEIKRIVEKYNIGGFLESHDPHHIAARIGECLADNEKMAVWRQNTIRAADDLCWEKEKRILIKVMEKYA